MSLKFFIVSNKGKLIFINSALAYAFESVSMIMGLQVSYGLCVYIIIQIIYFSLTSGAVKIGGIIASIICALVSLTPIHLMLYLYSKSCMMIAIVTESEVDENQNIR